MARGRAARGRPVRAARAGRTLVLLARRRGRAAAAGRRRRGDRAAAGDGPPRARGRAHRRHVVLSARTRASLLFADEVAAWPSDVDHLHARGRAAAGRRDARRRRAGAPRLRLRPDGVRRARHDAAARGRPRRRSRSRRALRWSVMKTYTLLGADGVPYQSTGEGRLRRPRAHEGLRHDGLPGRAEPAAPRLPAPPPRLLRRRGDRDRRRLPPLRRCQREKYRAWKAGEGRWAGRREGRGRVSTRGARRRRAAPSSAAAGRPCSPSPRAAFVARRRLRRGRRRGAAGRSRADRAARPGDRGAARGRHARPHAHADARPRRRAHASSSRSASSSCCASRARPRRPTCAACCGAAGPPGAILFKPNITSPGQLRALTRRCATPARPPARCRSSAPTRRAATSATSTWAPPAVGQARQVPGRDARAAAQALRKAGINVTLAPVADVPTSAGHRARRPRVLQRPGAGGATRPRPRSRAGARAASRPPPSTSPASAARPTTPTSARPRSPAARRRTPTWRRSRPRSRPRCR